MCQWFTNSGRIITRILSFAFLFRLLRVTSTTVFQSQRDIQNENHPSEEIGYNSSKTLDESIFKQWKTSSLAYGQLSEFQQQLCLRQKEKLNTNYGSKFRSIFESKFKLLFPDAVDIENFLKNGESGIHLIKENGRDHIKLNGFEIDLSMLTDYFYLIVSFHPIRYFDELTLMNLPLTQSTSLAIGAIFTDQIHLKRLIISNCVLHKDVNKDSFYESFSHLFLSHLKLVGCKGIESILQRINDSLVALILEDNEMEIDFGQLTELISRFKNLNQLSVNRNGILTYGFDNFFDFVYSKLELVNLSLINDGIFSRFIEKLSESKTNISVKTLTISYATDNSDLCSMRDLDKFRSLEKIILPHEMFNESFFPSLALYFKGQHKLKSIGALKNSSKENIPFKMVKGAEKVLFDLRNIRYYLLPGTTLKQMERMTSKYIDENSKWDETRCSSSFLKMPEMKKLRCYSPDGATLKAFINSTAKLESLSVECKSLTQLVSKASSPSDYIIPTLKCLEIYRKGHYINEENEIILFVLHNPSIVDLKIHFAHSTIFDKMSSLSNSKKIRYNIEEFTVQRVKLGDLECFFDCLSYMPKLKILNATYLSDSNQRLSKRPPRLIPLKIEQLVIDLHFENTPIQNILLTLLKNSPQLRVLTVKNLHVDDFNGLIRSLHYIPNLIHLKIINCNVTIKTIGLLIKELESLKWFSHLDVQPISRQWYFYGKLKKMELSFPGKINLNYKDK